MTDDFRIEERIAVQAFTVPHVNGDHPFKDIDLWSSKADARP